MMSIAIQCKYSLFIVLMACSLVCFAQDTATLTDTELGYLTTLYKGLHANPELSFHELNTARLVAEELEKMGLEVTSGVGGNGVVAMLKNGDGPTLLLRADMDALPVKELTGLAYASKVMFEKSDGSQVPVMHACGHDIHMSVLVGAVRHLIKEKNTWQGTLLIVFEPAEERGAGSKAMLDDGLYQRFARPDYNFAFHVSAELPAGTIGYTSGYAMANVDSVDIIVRGIGGHGAYPHKTKDPVVIAATLILQLQNIISREISPLEPAVITVGSIHGGVKNNVISDEVKLQLTVRSYSDQTRDYLLKRIQEIAEGVARTAGLPEPLLPVVKIKQNYTPSVYNEPALTTQITNTLKSKLGDDKVQVVPPVMAGEDFSRYARVEPVIPGTLLWLGAVAPEKYNLSIKNNVVLPGLHSAEFAPVPGPTIETGVLAMTVVVKNILAKQEP